MAEHPKKIGKYNIVGVLGKGAMGLVYRGEDPLLGRQVAIKVITGDDVSEEMQARFVHEARAVAAIDHPNIVVVYDLGEHDGKPYIAMELLKGEDLKAVMRRRGTLPLQEACEIIVQVCDGLAYAHERKIVHRDIKPANIHVCDDGRIKVMDFGVAKMESTSLTKTGMVIGTPDYMSPEQIQGKAVDTRSDIFSTAVVFYELLTKNKPFTAESITSVIYNVVFKAPPSFAELQLDVPPEVERIIAKGMAKDLNDRYGDIREMAADLRRYLGQGQPAGVADTGDEATKVLSEAEIRQATGVAKDGDGTVQVGESPTMRERAGGAPDAGTRMGAPAGAALAPSDEPAKNALPVPLLAGIGLAVVALAVVLVVVLGRDGAEAPPGPGGGGGIASAVPVDLMVMPWARIESLTLESGEAVELAADQRETPVRVQLAPGSYVMQVANAELGAKETIRFRVQGRGGRVAQNLGSFDQDMIDAAIKSLSATP